MMPCFEILALTVAEINMTPNELIRGIMSDPPECFRMLLG